MPLRRESQHWYLGLTGSQISDLFLKDRTREGVDSYWSKWSKWEQSACESSFNLWSIEKNRLLTVSPGNHSIMHEGGAECICMHLTCMQQGLRRDDFSFLLWNMQHLHHGTISSSSLWSSHFKCGFDWAGTSFYRTTDFCCICNLHTFVQIIHGSTRDL